ncbi:putative transcription factor SipA3 [Aspergillus luchuensis]|uniref:SNF1-interacting protein n=1 Tax=Aspergillus kawachii TaxID=1069201 RepID=A0A7R7WW86_ASPKA|nr:SNF1-interacting protein [Aspergillus luchuensis]BCR97855.1 SNF1-interacting protein [Aspergillus luchuensis]BCS10308.1 SNF1-interacting protein [Aspergillus luchuensis]GAA83428.1 transcription factor SipA3 [Aspergillus luchuensis IFO 4308]
MSTQPQIPLPQVGKLVSVVPVGLKEAALDSPTFRATTLHFSDQIEFLERWLDGYARAASKLSSELAAMESAANIFLSYSTNPLLVSEAVLDHDYTLQSMRRCGDSTKDMWNGLISTVKKMENLIAEPIRAFMHEDLRTFKEIRRNLEQTQKQYDYLLARYSSQSKSKEPSSLREDAFQLHEARKAYLKASMDYSIQAPQLRNALDRLLVRVSYDQWRELKIFHNSNGTAFAKWGQEMDRIKGWAHEMEGSERSSKRELLTSRKQIEEAAENAARPSRELEDYSLSTVPYLGSRPLSTTSMSKEARPEKQGWVFLRTLSGKPTRTIWVRRWAFLKHGIFGCLVQGSRTGGVEESERIGVLLCSVRAAFQEERRFCFEVKTKSNTIMLQAETQKELMDWIAAFEAAKRKALENPASTDLSVSGKVTVQDPAFAISQPPAPEFAADPSDSLTPRASDEQSSADRSGMLALPERDPSAMRNSSDLSSYRRLTTLDSESSAREHASRMMQKLDLHRKSNNAVAPSTSLPGAGGGIASLISASHSALGPGSPPLPLDVDGTRTRSSTFGNDPPSTLAPGTLANPPAPTTMSKAAVIVSNERGIGLGQADKTGGMPSGMMANLWGSSNWGFMNWIERERIGLPGEQDSGPSDKPASPANDPSKQFLTAEADTSSGSPGNKPPKSGPRHRQTVSLDGDSSKMQRALLGDAHDYPSYYPQQLKIQDAQFRLLFPDIKKDEPLVMVFRATWNPNDQQDFPGRAYVTTQNIYFYSHHFGLVLTTCISLESIKEVTAAPGRDCDFLYLHMIPPPGDDTPGRGTVKTFLEPLRLLQRRLNFLIHNSTAAEPLGLEATFKTLNRMESEALTRTPSLDSWEDVAAGDDHVEGGESGTEPPKKDVGVYIDNDLDMHKKNGNGKDTPKFRLPTQPVQYVPQGDLHLAAEKVFDTSAKAVFHILFGDKSAVWQLLLHQRRAKGIKQGPWVRQESNHLRRDFHYEIETADALGRTHTKEISDYQMIDVLNDHLCYVITDKRTPWHLPFKRSFRLVSKVVITFVAKGKCKLSIYTKVEWLWSPYGLQHIIDKNATNDLEQDALDLVDLVGDQVRRLGAHSRTKKAITIFGHIGRQNFSSQFSPQTDLQLKLRNPRIQRSLPQLLFERCASLTESIVSDLMMWMFAFLRWVWKTTHANKVILILLLSSMLINGFYSSRDAYEWWHDRTVGNFMARIGVSPDNVMTKAIYMRDIDDAIANTTIGHGSENVSDCFATFHQQTVRSPGNTISLGTSGFRDSMTRSAARRIQQTRERLGSYRHDLLVALRVVNSIEREVIQSEWERWLRQELRRCRQIQILLGKNEGEEDVDLEVDRSGPSVFAELTDDVQQWYETYCTSCQAEHAQIEDERPLGAP